MLNFDPRKWLAEYADDASGKSVAVVATVAATTLELKKTNSGCQPATLATPATLSGWARHLARLDPCQPPGGFSMGRWQILYDDALWLLENYGSQAARDGWSGADLFGLWPDKPRWGGIADRLGGARSLVMDCDRASWRALGEIERYARGVYPQLQPLWDAVALRGDHREA